MRASLCGWRGRVPGPTPGPDGMLRLAYLGYMRRDKGFWFMLEALEALDDTLLARVQLVVAARRGPAEAMARLETLRPRLAELAYHDGYVRDDLDRLLAGVDIGLVPVLWHDNLPQVAIEMHARHIPLLTADMGGARELGRDPAMVFPAGDTGAFQARITALLAGEVDFTAYWAGAMPPVTMPSHVADLKGHYDTDGV